MTLMRTLTDHRGEGISHTQTGRKVMTVSHSPCYSSGRWRVTKKPAGRGLPGHGRRVQATPSRTQREGKNTVGGETAHVKAKCAPAGMGQGACWAGPGEEKGGRGPHQEGLHRKVRIYPEVKDTPVKGSELESSRPEMIFRDQSGSGGD